MAVTNDMKRRERFLSVAEKRTNRILEDLRLLGNCSNKSNYSYTPEEVEKMFRSIEEEVDHVKMLFRLNEGKKEFKW